MINSEILERVVLKTPEGSEVKVAVAAEVFIEAFGKGMSVAGDMGSFWKFLAERDIAHFVMAEYKERIVGTGAVFPYKTFASIGYMAVDPRFQKNGIGNLIFRNLLEYTKKIGIRRVILDATEAGKKLYLRYGFREKFTVKQYEIMLNENYGDQSIEVQETIPRWCINMDRQAFGGDRSALLEMIVEKGGRLLVIEKEGYGIVWKNRLGPVVVKNVGAAVAIVKYSQSMGAMTIFVPLHNEMPRKFLSNLKETSHKNVRMVLGDECMGNLKYLYAPFSPATG